MYSYCAKADISIGQAAVPFPETSVSDSVAKVKLDIFGEKVMSCSRLNVIGGSLSGLLLMAAMCGARAEAQATPDPSTGPASASIPAASTRPCTSSGTPMPPQSMDAAATAPDPQALDQSAAPPIATPHTVKGQ